MLKIKSFEDLRIWQDALEIATELYIEFKDSRDFSFRDQLIRASLSVPLNIAEGFERNNEKEYNNFLRYAKGSAGELRTQLLFTQKVGLLEKEKALLYVSRIITLSKQIQSLMNSISQKVKK